MSFHERLAARCKQCKPSELASIATLAFDETRRALEEAMAKMPPGEPLACLPGCAWCCHLTVVVSVPEVMRLAEHLRQTLSPAALDALQARCEARAAERKTVSIVRWERTRREPCVLLVDNQCSAYEARPLACRAANSVDAKACEAGHADNSRSIPAYLPQLAIYGQTRDLIGQSLRTRGGPGPLELSAALAIVLRVPADQPLAAATWRTAAYERPPGVSGR
jgi:Fe-S-cluster containining protein